MSSPPAMLGLDWALNPNPDPSSHRPSIPKGLGLQPPRPLAPRSEQYTAPEALNDPLAPKTLAGDVFAFGVLALEICTRWGSHGRGHRPLGCVLEVLHS